MNTESYTFLINQIENKSYHLLSNNNDITQKNYATALKRVVSTYGMQNGFLKKISNIWIRFINCIKYLFKLSNWQVASSFLRAEQKSKHAHSLKIMKEVVNVIEKSNILSNIPDHEKWLLDAITTAHKSYIKIYSCSQKKITDLQLKILVKSSYIDAEDKENFYECYNSIVEKTFDKQAKKLATKVARAVINKLPNKIDNGTKVLLYPQICSAAKSSLISAYDPLSIRGIELTVNANNLRLTGLFVKENIKF